MKLNKHQTCEGEHFVPPWWLVLVFRFHIPWKDDGNNFSIWVVESSALHMQCLIFREFDWRQYSEVVKFKSNTYSICVCYIFFQKLELVAFFCGGRRWHAGADLSHLRFTDGTEDGTWYRPRCWRIVTVQDWSNFHNGGFQKGFFTGYFRYSIGKWWDHGGMTGYKWGYPKMHCLFHAKTLDDNYRDTPMT